MLAYKVEQQGNSLLLSCSDGRQELISTWENAFTFMLTPCDMALVYGLDEFVRHFLSLLPKQAKTDLENNARVVMPNKERIFYMPNRMFSITFAGKEVNFFGLSRYEDTEPQTLDGLLDLGNRILKAYEAFGIFNPPKLSSPVSVYSEILDKLPFPRSCDLPDSAMPLIDSSAKIMLNEWRENYKIGHWNKDEVADYDLCAGYPSCMAELPDISNATFFENDNLIKSDFGVLTGDLNIVKDVSPFASDDGLYRKGLHRDYSITTGQLHRLTKYGIGTFEFKHGYFLTLPPKYGHPFKSTMEALYKARDTDNPIQKKIAKGISVGVWGMLCQRYEQNNGGFKLGKCFNGIYGLMTSSRCSNKVLDFIYGYQIPDSVVSVTVDGILAHIKVPIENTGKMGSWRVNEPSNALVASLLYSWLNDKKPNSLFYDGMIKLVNDKPKSSVLGDIDLNLLERGRTFEKLPKNWGELLNNKYTSKPYTIGD